MGEILYISNGYSVEDSKYWENLHMYQLRETDLQIFFVINYYLHTINSRKRSLYNVD